MTHHEPPSASDTTSFEPLNDDAIALRAFELWQQAGQPQGMALEHWTQAEKELSREQRERTEHAVAETESGFRASRPGPPKRSRTSESPAAS